MLRAVLFDWGGTLMRDEWSDEIALEGYTAGFAALNRDGLPEAAVFARYLSDHQAKLFARETEDEIDIGAVMAGSFHEHGVELTDDDVRLFLQAAHGIWSSYYLLADAAHALLDALRARGLKLALVSNTASPGWLLQPILEQQGIAQRVDTVVLSSEVGKRKPHRTIFERALGELQVDPEDALFVGDRLDADVLGASRLGMTTVQALWFRADDVPVDAEPDYQAFTLMDVLNVADRLAA
ncbi:MAG TPA: HAD family hydrolase [Gaiellaceae bacterium]|nr:HAD family hydrolase [Gaiellaceae bacterium]